MSAAKQLQLLVIMVQSFLSRAALIFLSTTLAVLTVACREEKQTTADDGKQQHALNNESAATPPTITAPLVSPTSSTRQRSEIEPSSFEQGLDKATSAFSISQSAQSIEDWNLVASQFQEAIALLEAVPVNSPYFPNAQTKILEFQRQLKYAQKQATRPINPKVEAEPQRIVVVAPQPSLTPKITLIPQTLECGERNLSQCPRQTPCTGGGSLTRSERRKLPIKLLLARKCPSRETLGELPPIAALPPPDLNQPQVFVTPIKRRVGGTPIIEVIFNGNQQFEMILDTGASGTVITQKMADALGVMPVGKAKANTASSKAVEFPIGYVDSMEVGGARVNQVAVAIAGADLETGLLGHDFFGDYDLTIKRDVVEFRPQSHLQVNSVGTGKAVPNSNSRNAQETRGSREQGAGSRE